MYHQPVFAPGFCIALSGLACGSPRTQGVGNARYARVAFALGWYVPAPSGRREASKHMVKRNANAINGLTMLSYFKVALSYKAPFASSPHDILTPNEVPGQRSVQTDSARLGAAR
jgi:hypothetical protein